ncbi:MAG TPA: TlpA disulfide reductase family protein [Pseudonocardiaceae bacterium]
MTRHTWRAFGRRRIAVLAAVLAGLVLVLSGCATGSDAVAQGDSFTFVSPGGKTEIFYPVSERKPLPALSGQNLTDPSGTIGTGDFPNDVVVLNIWGSWCGPCRAEAPQLVQLLNQTKASGVQVLGIDVRDQLSAAQDYVHDYQINYPSIFDPAGRSLLALHNYPRNVVPSTIILDRQHRVAAVYLEAILAGKVLPEVQQLAAAP